MPDNDAWVEFKAMLRTPCRQTSEGHAERARMCADMADFGVAGMRGALMGSPPAVQLALMHAQVALALKAMGA